MLPILHDGCISLVTCLLAFFFGYMAWALRCRGIEVLFFCHNVVEHETATWKSILTRRVLKHADRFEVRARMKPICCN